MEGVMVNPQSERAIIPSHGSSMQRSVSKKVNPKRRNCDSGRTQNHRKAFPTENVCKPPFRRSSHRKAFPTENVCKHDDGSFKSSSSVVLMPSQKPPLLPLPPNVSPKYASSVQFSHSINVKVMNAGNSGRLLESSMKGRTEEEAKRSETMITSSSPLGPDPGDLPRVVLGIFRATAGCISWLSPPPSSLPLPKFSIKQKGNCRTSEAAVAAGGSGIDLGGATHGLRRLLRIP